MGKMDIIDDIIKKYTFNGVVNVNAIEDDIATIQNQIETDEFLLKDAKARSLNTAPLLTKIQDEKSKLSNIKAALKRVKEKQNSTEAMVNMLAVSGVFAKELTDTENDVYEKEIIDEANDPSIVQEKKLFGASVDISEITDMPNSIYIRPTIDFENMALTLVFYDLLDYPILIKLLEERRKSQSCDKNEAKKPRRVFIRVDNASESGGISRSYEFVFKNCQICSILDGEYPSIEYGTTWHEFQVTFRYDDVEINHGTTNKTKDCKETEDYYEEADIPGTPEKDAPEVRNV